MSNKIRSGIQECSRRGNRSSSNHSLSEVDEDGVSGETSLLDDDSDAGRLPNRDNFFKKGAICCISIIGVASAAIGLCWWSQWVTVTRVLFVGNSFTYVNDLPHQFQRVAWHFGHKVEVERSTIDACNLWFQRGAADPNTAELLERSWDWIVLQDHSFLPTLAGARLAYMYPAIQDFYRQRKKAKLALYLTMPYHDGWQHNCPAQPYKPQCWPFGNLSDFTDTACDMPGYQNYLGSFSCMGYSVARGYFSAAEHTPADVVVPAGLAWMLFRGVGQFPLWCKNLIDQQYTFPMDFELTPPSVIGPADLKLHNLVGGKPDIHPTKVGQYLNALTFYTVLFGKSPIGAGQPYCEDNCFVDNWTEVSPGGVEPPLAESTLFALQHAALAAVEQCGSRCHSQTAFDV